MSERDQRRPPSPLESERGSTTVSSNVVSQIVGMTAGEVPGIHMGSGTSRAAGGLFGSVTGSRGRTPGISIQVGRVETAIDLTMEIEYGRDILPTTEMVRERVTERVESLTGLRVTELNVTINDVIFPEGEGEGWRGYLGYEDRTLGIEAGGREREATEGPEPIEVEARERRRYELEDPGEDATTELRLGAEEVERRRLRRRRRRER